jgi:nicotinamide mononucleotide (NMN) deamidase PncC
MNGDLVELAHRVAELLKKSNATVAVAETVR